MESQSIDLMDMLAGTNEKKIHHRSPLFATQGCELDRLEALFEFIKE